MKTVYALAAFLLFSSIVKADDIRVACGGPDLGNAPIGLRMENDHVFKFYQNGEVDPTFAVGVTQTTIFASNEKAQPRGADVQHVRYDFKGRCADQSVTVTKSLVGGFAGTLPGGDMKCVCDILDF